MKKKSIGLAVGILAVVLLSVVGTVPATAVVNTVDVAEDTYIDAWDPGTALGGPGGNPNWVWIGSLDEGRYRAGVFKFHLPTYAVSSAALSIYVYAGAGQPVTQRVIRMSTNNWNETTASAYDVWAAGADPANTLDTKTVGASDIGSRVEWNVTSGVQAVGPGGTISFYMDQIANGPFSVGTLSKEGDATLTYTAKLLLTPVPEPSSMMALSAGLLGLYGFVARRRR